VTAVYNLALRRGEGWGGGGGGSKDRLKYAFTFLHEYCLKREEVWSLGNSAKGTCSVIPSSLVHITYLKSWLSPFGGFHLVE
jgi:hypothetical protein